MPTFEDWLNDPVSIINNIFSSDKHNFDAKVQEYFEKKLINEKNYYSIPSLNEVPLHEIKPNSLVRYRCMIQDVFNPVYYADVQRIRHKVSGDVSYMSLKYRESLDLPDGYEIDGDVLKEHLDELRLGPSDKGCGGGDESREEYKSNLEQRMTFYCVPIPGENKWTKHSYKAANAVTGSNAALASNSANRSSKRSMDAENENEEETATSNSQEEKENQNQNENQQQVESTVESSGAMEYGPVICKETDTDTTTTICKVCYKYRVHSKNENQEEEEVVKTKVTKKSRVVENETTETSSAGKKWSRRELNFPLGDHEQGHACLVKIYDRFDDFKLNDMVEFVGILSQDPSLAYDEDEHHDHHPYHLVGDSKDWQQEEEEEKREEEKKTETIRLMDTNAATVQNNTPEIMHNVIERCKCNNNKELVDVSVTKQVNHTHTHRKVVLSAYPPSLVPRLHCVLSHKLHHNNPLLGRPWSQKSIEEKKSEKKENDSNDYWSKQLDEFISSLKSSQPTASQMGSQADPLYILRKEIVDTFQELLLGDALAAEYLLMHLLSSVFTRKDVTVLGKFTLNITNVPALKNDDEKEDEKENEKPLKKDSTEKNFSQCFFEAIQHLVPTSHLFPLTTDNLNKWNLIPNKDYNKDKLLSGMLQLPEDFHLCIDETVLNTGKLDQKGLINLNSIGDIIKWQKMNYDFSFHQQEFNTNIRVLLKLDADTSNFNLDEYKKFAETLATRTSFLNNVRRYLTIVGKLDYEMNEHMQKLVENDIVSMRKEEAASHSKNKMSIDDFHLLLVIARLQTLSYGKTQLGLNEWNRAKSLQFERIKRQSA